MTEAIGFIMSISWGLSRNIYETLLPTFLRDSNAALTPVPWGDGILDASLTTFLYPARWDNVGADELAFYLPSLAHQTREHRQPLIARLRMALLARLYIAALQAGQGNLQPREAVDPAAMLRLIKALDITSVGALDVASEGAQSAREYDGTLRSRSPGTTTACDSRADWIYELSVLWCLNRALQIASGELDEAKELAQNLTISDLLVVSIYTSVNAAYIDATYECMHESFTTAAWLGHLLRGRSVYLPSMVAEYLLDGVSWPGMDADADGVAQGQAGTDTCSEGLLCWHVEQAFGIKRLMRSARQVNDSGTMALLHARRPQLRQRRTPPVWNLSLHGRISRHVDSLEFIPRGATHPELTFNGT